MAEAFAHIHGKGRVEAFSAGSKPSGKINPKTVEAMKEIGYDLTKHKSKSIQDVPIGALYQATRANLHKISSCAYNRT